jgi:hypothetical protein
MKAGDRTIYQEGDNTSVPRQGTTLDEQFGHYPLLEAADNIEWYAQEDLKDDIPRYIALDDAMVYMVVKIFSPGERGKFFGVDFDQQGNIRGARRDVGIPPTVSY